MRAAYLPAPGVVEVDDFPVPEPGPGELLVRMEYASICGSDVHITFDGFHQEECLRLPGYPGHEGVGTVVGGDVDGVAEGSRVLAVPLPTPGGCFAEYLAVDRNQVVELPAGGDPRRLLLGQQLGTTIFALRRFCRGAGDGVAAVIGCGSAGLFFVQQLLQLGFHTVVAADVNAYRLGIAGRLGARTVQVPDDDLVTAVLDVTGGVGADLVIEAVGYDSCRNQAVEAVRVGGTVGCFGYPERGGLSGFPVDRAFRKCVSVHWVSGTQNEPGLVSFRDAVTAIGDGSIEVDYCLGGGFALEDMPRAMATARDHGRDLVKVEVGLQPG